MAPTQSRRLINSQAARLGEIQLVSERLIGQPYESFTWMQLQSCLDSINVKWAEAKSANADLLGGNIKRGKA
jgi:hypothetical protein